MVWVGLLRWSSRARRGPQTPAPVMRMFREWGCEVGIAAVVGVESCFDGLVVLGRTHGAVGLADGIRK